MNMMKGNTAERAIYCNIVMNLDDLIILLFILLFSINLHINKATKNQLLSYLA